MPAKNFQLGVPISVTTGVVQSRPSRVIKSPYVCDLHLPGQDDTVVGHTPSLGCGGMVDSGATVLCVRKDDTTSPTSGKCKYGVIASVVTEKDRTYVVGVDPAIAEKLAGEILAKSVIPSLSVSRASKLQTQKTYKDSRFDYCGVTDDGSPFICEVKNVSIARYEDLPPRQLIKMDFSERNVHSKVAVFPSGYRPKGQTHSERALKHVQTLRCIKKEHPGMRCIMLFVVQRSDINTFQASNGDEQYKQALKEAHESGVEVYAVRMKWEYDEERSTLTPMVDADDGCTPLIPIAW